MSLGAVAARMGSAEKKVKVRATTDAKRLAADATINLRDVTATGADGRMVTKSDVEAFLAEQRRGGTTTAGEAAMAGGDGELGELLGQQVVESILPPARVSSTHAVILVQYEGSACLSSMSTTCGNPGTK